MRTATTRFPPKLELFLVGETVVELTADVLARFALLLHELLSLHDGLEHLPFVRLAQHAADEHFEKNHEGFVKREDEVELAHRVEVSVERLDEEMNLLEHDELVERAWHAGHEVEAGVASVDELVVPLLDDVAHLGLSGQDLGRDVPHDASLLRLGVGREVLRQSNLALAGHENDEVPPAGRGGVRVVTGTGDGVGGTGRHVGRGRRA